MPTTTAHPISRRSLLKAAAGGSVILALPACATLPGFSMVEVIRRLLLRSSENAFARLTAPGGFWDEQVGALGLTQLIGTRGDVLSRILTSTVFKNRLEDAFADIAIEGSARAAPLVADAVQTIGFANALELVRGGPTAATQALRGELGLSLVDAMVPELGDAIRIASDPLVAELLNTATGADVGGVAQRLAGNIDNAIWNEIGVEEAAIRADPGATGDPLLIGTFGGLAGA